MRWIDYLKYRSIKVFLLVISFMPLTFTKVFPHYIQLYTIQGWRWVTGIDLHDLGNVLGLDHKNDPVYLIYLCSYNITILYLINIILFNRTITAILENSTKLGQIFRLIHRPTWPGESDPQGPEHNHLTYYQPCCTIQNCSLNMWLDLRKGVLYAQL